jgi:hypothetical protein
MAGNQHGKNSGIGGLFSGAISRSLKSVVAGPSDPKNVWIGNFRVSSLGAIVVQLRAASIAVEVDPKGYPDGRFARLYDPEGNPIELREPESGMRRPEEDRN